jgi:hypothetical protein
VADQDTLISFLKNKTDEEWDTRQQPYLLSLVRTEFPEGDEVYEQILAGERLKAFAKRTASDATYKVVEHPRQKARVGLIPSAAEFTWADEMSFAKGRAAKSVDGPADKAPAQLQSFLHTLAALRDDELDQMNIPLKIIVKLAGLR